MKVAEHVTNPHRPMLRLSYSQSSYLETSGAGFGRDSSSLPTLVLQRPHRLELLQIFVSLFSSLKGSTHKKRGPAALDCCRSEIDHFARKQTD